MKYLLIIGLCFFNTSAWAQDINVVEDPMVTQLINRHVELNRMTETVEGLPKFPIYHKY